MMHSTISAVRLFGSAARGDDDGYSDVDLLVVQQESISKRERLAIRKELSRFGENLSISWYSEKSLAKMFEEGHLFAVHLVKESARILSKPDFIDSLGAPKPYTHGSEDIAGFRSILEGVAPSLAASPRNAVFEAGLLYVTARNVAMIASAYLPSGPFFGRESPFQLDEEVGINFPLSRVEHRSNMLARTVGHRGIGVAVSEKEVFQMAKSLLGWTSQVQVFTNKMENIDAH